MYRWRRTCHNIDNQICILIGWQDLTPNNEGLWLAPGYVPSCTQICSMNVYPIACTSSMIGGNYMCFLWVKGSFVFKKQKQTKKPKYIYSRIRAAAVMEALLSALFSSEKEELYILDCLAYFMVFMAACCFVTLLFENVPYGRYSTSKYGFPVNAKVAWFIQELPAFLVPFSLLVWTSPARTSLLPNQLLIAMYFCHYVQRWVFT